MISRVLRVVLWSCLAVFIVFAIRSVIDDCAPPVEAYHKLVLDGKELWTQLHFDPERPPKEAEVEDAKEYRRIQAFLGDRAKEAEFFPDMLRKNVLKENSNIRMMLLLSDSEHGFAQQLPNQHEQMISLFDTTYNWEYTQSFNVTHFDNEGIIQMTQHGLAQKTSSAAVTGRRMEWRWGKDASVEGQFGVKVLIDPDMWRHGPVYLHILLMSLPEEEIVSSVSSTLISRPLIPALLRKPRRYLLKDISGELLESQLSKLNLNGRTTVESIPSRVEIGAVIEHRRLSENMIKRRFGVHSSLLGYNSPSDHEYPYKLPILVNNFVTPRDEYLPLVPLEGLEGPPTRIFEFNRHYPRSDQCPSDVVLGEEERKRNYIDTHAPGLFPPPPSSLSYEQEVDQHGSVLKQKWRDVRDTEVEIVYRPATYSYWFFLSLFNEAFTYLDSHTALSSYDIDSLKLMLTGASPAVLCVVYAVAILHWVFQTISISSDIVFWRNLSSYQGFSVNALLLECLMGGSILLYLRDAGDSKLVQFFVFARLALLLWKISKLTRPRFHLYGGFLPYVVLESRRSGESKGGSQMDAIEAAWMWRLFLCLIPFVIVVALYQLVFVPQAGWYSWLVSSLACCSYMGGFVAMTPQLYCNYLLKSVEHMPWRVLFYQFLNTFIDDLFALLIRMPQMHKMSVFRDDIVFICFLYQRWLYRGRAPRRLEEEVEEQAPLKAN
eukprot:GHVS01077709.1.p1 GENE.GHVS01077709.1~~GHVS01077709.1.p1  ORF type:complete len:717 (-),score=93.49 GHVS01077709.1:278-2428(-)